MEDRNEHETTDSRSLERLVRPKLGYEERQQRAQSMERRDLGRAAWQTGGGRPSQERWRLLFSASLLRRPLPSPKVISRA